MNKYVAYYRVSTTTQGISGLGLEAQQSAVNRFVANNEGELIESFTDIESGKRSDNRPELLKAFKLSRDLDATLIIAKLDRLSRNVVFIGLLLESKVKFKCCDMPTPDNFTIHIFAAMAEKEREMISQRTISALSALKQRGVKLGNPKADKEFMDKIRSMRKPKEIDERDLFMVEALLKQGLSVRKIAAKVNSMQDKTMFNERNLTTSYIYKLIKIARKHASQLTDNQ
jgi:DNA invertase Pin-like site-specific DNA recombinase